MSLPRKKKTVPSGSAATRGILSLVGKAAVTVLLILVITGSIVASALTVYVINFLEDESEFDIHSLDLGYTSILYANDPQTGEPYELKRVHGEGGNRIWVDIAEMPENLLNATIAAEDIRFREHQGVDWKMTFKAFVNMFIPISGQRAGGSTITQQLIKNITGDDQVRVDRKISEIFRALALEKEYSKDDILEAYLNTIHLGNNTDGVQAAANLYFGKDVSELDLAESAALIAITQNPSRYELLKHEENNRERRAYILDNMLEAGMISQSEHDRAVKETLEIQEDAYANTFMQVNTYFEDYVIEEVISDMVDRLGWTRDYASSQLFNGGYRIYTTVDERIQDILDRKFIEENNEDIFPATVGLDPVTRRVVNEDPPQCAMMIMDYEGNIVGIAGGRGEKVNRGFNRATAAKRQPGSSIKPLSIYGPAMEFNMITWSTVLDDEPVLNLEDPSGEPNWPQNEILRYLGPITVDEALQRSTNTIAVRIGLMLTPQTSYDFLTKSLGVSTLVGSGNNHDIAISPMALGALTEGITVHDSTAAYQIYGNGGLYYAPHSYTLVLDSAGNVVLENDPMPKRVISEDTAEVMNKLLGRVTTGPLGTGRPAALTTGMPSVGKTGTSQNNKDNWFVGLTPYYVAGVWVGYDEPLEMQGRYMPTLVWKNVMTEVHEGLAIRQFPTTGEVVEAEYCTVSGDLATDDCVSRATGYYKPGNVPGSCTECIYGGRGSGGSSDDGPNWYYDE